jgi:hypothetical protein
MPSQSRSQRRRQAARQQQPRRPTSQQPNAEAASPPANTGTTIALDAPISPAPAAPRQASRTTRRILSRPAPEPVDYSKDYAAVRRDLRWIMIWTALLFATMIVLRFSGLLG